MERSADKLTAYSIDYGRAPASGRLVGCIAQLVEQLTLS